MALGIVILVVVAILPLTQTSYPSIYFPPEVGESDNNSQTSPSPFPSTPETVSPSTTPPKDQTAQPHSQQPFDPSSPQRFHPQNHPSLYHQLFLSIQPYLFTYAHSHQHSRPFYQVQPFPATEAVYPVNINHQYPPSHHQRHSDIPSCASNSSRNLCLEDAEYPSAEIQHAVQYHFEKIVSLYADVIGVNTEASVHRPNTLAEETYLCPSVTSYVKPLRALNTVGSWRVIVNNVEIHYQKLTQTTRIEECLTSGDACPLLPLCYESKCLQKSIYHRFLVYDPYDQFFPFAIDTFRLPATCACVL